MDIALSIVITFLLTLVNGFFSAAEMAIVSARRGVLESEVAEGDTKAQAVIDVSSDRGYFLATIQVAITLVGFASSAFAATSLSTPFGNWLYSIGVHADLAAPLAVIVITLIVSYFSVVVGELVPKSIGLANAEAVAKAVVGPMKAFMRIARPLVFITSASANAMTSLMGIDTTNDHQEVTEEELRYIVKDSDDLSDEEKSMIHEVIEMGDTVVREVMVPRVDMTAMEDTSTIGEVLRVMRQTGFSRIPIYHENIDRIVGIAHIKDLLEPALDQRVTDEKITRFVRAADYVPDTKDIIPLLTEMQTSRDQMVIAVDEYGGTAGVITIEDIVEEIVGEIEDEFDPDNKYLTQLSDREWLVDGRFSLDDADELGWPVGDTEEYETIAGFVLDLAGHLPRPGETFEKEGYLFRVQSMRRRRLFLLRVIAPEPQEDDTPTSVEENTHTSEPE
ncbi:MAG: HlyC/CorC family transporter [Atopobiaceae bacterium]|nr:HlyC/CorC family transporter [Atopobiaceae bacterium]